MDILFLCVVIFLFLLAVFDLSVGVSNDAVNFMTSAIGSKAGSFKRVVIVASIGVFIGAAMSNGMMDIARHGIFRPENFSFYDLICIFMAVMVTDIILLDVFNTLGLPTSTTVSLVFGLLGATFIVSLLKMGGGSEHTLNDLINTEKALSVILGIFLSVAIAFVFGTLVMFLSRAIFTFNYTSKLKWKIGIFGGICTTAIVYFLLLKGFKDLTIMTPEFKAWISTHTLRIVLVCFAVSTVLMQLLHACRVNVLKVIVLLGTFALAMAFAGNDLVNFIGIPLTSLESFQDYTANGSGDPHGWLMGSLNGPSHTNIWFLIGAGVIMVVSLATSKKARHVTETEIGLGSQSGGDEMFGSSRIARRLVRWTLSFIQWMRMVTPDPVRRWLASRFDSNEIIMEHGAAFDLLRGAVNLVLAGALIAIGTSLKLPLSTTFVTFMVAMGSSLADRAWGRESAVFRITGVISVIGGWFVTAGVAFMGAGLVAMTMHWGGQWVMLTLGALTLFLLWRSNQRFHKRKAEETGDTMFQTILQTEDKAEAWRMLQLYMQREHGKFVEFAQTNYEGITSAFIREDAGALIRTQKKLMTEKNMLKNVRRKTTLCMRSMSREVAMEKNTWFHLANNCCMSMLYNLRRIDEVCQEHVDNNFRPLPVCYIGEFDLVRERVGALLQDTIDMLGTGSAEMVPVLRRHCDEIKDVLSDSYHSLYDHLREGDQDQMTVVYVYMNVLQETQEMVSSLRKYLRAYAKLCDTSWSSRRPLRTAEPAPALTEA